MTLQPILYHAPLACSLAVRIAAVQAKVALSLKYVDLNSHRLDDGTSFLDINPLGQVSTLHLPNQTWLTETSAVLLWVQSRSQNPHFRRLPTDPDYFQMIRWIGFCATELHKQIFRIVFYDEATNPVKDRIRALAPQRFTVLETQLADRPYILGDHFSAADAYLTWVLVLAERAGIAPTGSKILKTYQTRVMNDPPIKAVIDDDIAKKAQLG